MRVSDAMTSDPRTIRDDSAISEAFRVLAMERFGALPVLDDEDRLVGIVSYLDLLQWARPSQDRSRSAASLRPSY